MRIEEDIKLDFKDVLIRPKRSTLSSRKEVDLNRKYIFKHSKCEWNGIPIMAANMDGGCANYYIAVCKVSVRKLCVYTGNSYVGKTQVVNGRNSSTQQNRCITNRDASVKVRVKL